MTTKYQPNAANQYAKIAHGTEVVEPEYDSQGNLLHDATRKYTWDADIHLMSVTMQGSPQSSPHLPSEEPGTAGATGRGATGSVASGQASGLPHIAPHNALDEAPSKTTTTRFLYDALHRRLGRVKDNGEVTVFVYEGWNVIAEKTQPKAAPLEPENLKLETRYTWGEDLSGSLQGAGGIGGLLRSTTVEASTNGTRSRAERDSQSQAAHEGGERRGAARSNTEHEHTFSYDSNGNVILLTDTQGRESARYAYDAFGKTLTAAGPAARGNRYRFSTKPVEEESGLVYYGYRYYDPVTGRWPSRDPIGEKGGVNVYRFAKNDLSVNFDRFGLSAVCSCAPFAAGAALVDGPLPVGDVVALSVLTGASLVDLAMPGPGTGNCSKGVHGVLQAAVDYYKEVTGIVKKCKDNDCCWVLSLKKTAWLMLAISRDTINSQCYDGGDPGHQQASSQAWTNVGTCERILNANCGS